MSESPDPMDARTIAAVWPCASMLAALPIPDAPATPKQRPGAKVVRLLARLRHALRRTRHAPASAGCR